MNIIKTFMKGVLKAKQQIEEEQEYENACNALVDLFNEYKALYRAGNSCGVDYSHLYYDFHEKVLSSPSYTKVASRYPKTINILKSLNPAENLIKEKPCHIADLISLYEGKGNPSKEDAGYMFLGQMHKVCKNEQHMQEAYIKGCSIISSEGKEEMVALCDMDTYEGFLKHKNEGETFVEYLERNNLTGEDAGRKVGDYSKVAKETGNPNAMTEVWDTEAHVEKMDFAKDCIVQIGEQHEKDLVDFGNYLLSEERANNIRNTHSSNQVTDADIANWKAKNN